MTPRDIRPFSELLRGVFDTYRRDASGFLQDVFWTGLIGYDFADVKDAFMRHLRDPERGQFEPKLADIVRLLDGTQSDRAALAWTKVLQAMRQIGAYTDVAFDDAIIHAVINDMGGWPKLCQVETEKLGFEQTRFHKTYGAYCAAKTFTYPPFLGGSRSSDDMYAMKGLDAPPVELVGKDKGKCMEVIANGTKGEVGGGTLISSHSVLRLIQQGARRKAEAALPMQQGSRNSGNRPPPPLPMARKVGVWRDG